MPSTTTADRGETAVDAPPVPAPERPEPRWWVRHAEPLAAVFLTSLLFLLGLGGDPRRLLVPLGGGDLLPAYTAARVWSQGAPFGDASFGFPFGMDMRYYPTADVLQNLVAGLGTWLTGNPFLGLNTVFAASFPLTALAALWVFRIAGLGGPFRLVAAVALTFVPYHWYRLEHVHLATMYSAVLGVGLALLVGNGTVERRLRSPARRRTLAWGAVLVLVIAASGIYYACFTILLCGAAWVYRATRAARWRDLVLAGTPAAGVVTALGAVLAPATLFGWLNPPLEPVAARLEVESVQYAGAFLFTLLPAPISRIPGFGPVNAVVEDAYTLSDDYIWSGVLWYANFGSVATVAALAVCAVGGFLLARRAAAVRATGAAPVHDRVASGAVSLGLVALLGATCVAFFVPWGLNYLFSYLVSPQLRGWDRLVPVMFTLLFVAAGLVLQRVAGRRPAPRVTAALTALALLVVVFDSVLPHRALMGQAAADGSRYSGAGYEYAAQLNQAVPGDCGVLELPYVGFPEEPTKVGMRNYEPLWPALTNPGKSWSFGAVKGTTASEWQRVLGDDLDADDVGHLRAGGFCAVHVDQRGYTSGDAVLLLDRLRSLLGEPVAGGLDGQWVAFALPTSGGPVVPAEELAQAPDGVGTFYSPPRVTPGDGAPAEPQTVAMRSHWWLPQEPARFTVASLEGGPEFDSVRGSLVAGPCLDQEVVAELRSADGEVAQTVRLDPGEETELTLQLDRPTRQAQLTLTTSGPPCGGEGVPGAVALVDPHAVG